MASLGGTTSKIEVNDQAVGWGYRLSSDLENNRLHQVDFIQDTLRMNEYAARLLGVAGQVFIYATTVRSLTVVEQMMMMMMNSIRYEMF